MNVIVLGAGGFIGNNMVKRLVKQGHFVIGVDLKQPDFETSLAHQFILFDLRNQACIDQIFNQPFDQVYHFAADMGGAGYVFTGENDAQIMNNSMQINLNVASGFKKSKSKKLFFSSSACVYPVYNQQDELLPNCDEHTVYPALPDSEYGWEKIFAERLFLNFARNYELDIKIGRLHNIYGEGNPFKGGKEKAPAALIRKVLTTADNSIEVWGSGEQTRTFLYIDDCIDAIQLLMDSDVKEPLNVGSECLITINGLCEMIAKINEKNISIVHIDGPIGVNGRCSNNNRIKSLLNWEPKIDLETGINRLNNWIFNQIRTI